ncbi:MAG: amidohydrolase family protein [Acidimicrobiales bacterium]
MKLPRRLSLSPERRRRLVSVARGELAPDVVVRAPSMLDVYTGEVRSAELTIAEGRIAWVGEVGASGLDPTFNLRDGVVIPGFIEPHCHPDIVYNPRDLASALAARGTTTVCADTAFLSLLLDDDEFFAVLEGMSHASVKFLWNLRGCLDGVLPAELGRLDSGRLQRLLAEIPDLVATGEMTAWPDLLNGDTRLAGLVEAAITRGLRIDGHAAGASARTLGPLAAAGITADHEAITVEDLHSRIRLGYWVMLRHSSLRPDARVLGEGVASGRLSPSRVMLTTDGSVAVDIVEGHLDGVVRELLAVGVRAVDAVRMATLNPATYLGLDAHVGGIAPGRSADLVLVDSLESFRPRLVFCEGVPVTPYTTQVGFNGWRDLRATPFRMADLDAGRLVDACRAGPTMRLEGVITRLVASSAELAADSSYVALVGRDGSWIVAGVLQGIAVPALASTFSGSGDAVLLGRDPESLVTVYREVISIGGGIGTGTHTVPLEVLGTMFDGTVSELAAGMRELASDLRLPAGMPPLEYLLLFLTLAVLPDVRLTPLGSMMVKTREILYAPIELPVVTRTAERG